MKKGLLIASFLDILVLLPRSVKLVHDLLPLSGNIDNSRLVDFHLGNRLITVQQLFTIQFFIALELGQHLGCFGEG